MRVSVVGVTLATDGTGFIGSHLVEHFVKEGEDVRIS